MTRSLPRMLPRGTALRAAVVAGGLVATVVLGGCADSSTTPAAPPPAAVSTTAPTPAATTTPTPSATPTPTVVRAAPNPCAGNTAAQLVRVRLAVQHLWMCERTHLVKDTPITSGMSGQYTETPRGRYRIQGVNRHTTLTLNTGKQYRVQYWIPFDAPLFGFHDSSWQTFPYGSSTYRTDGSHGCVHMPLAAIAFLAGWAHIGASVSIA